MTDTRLTFKQMCAKFGVTPRTLRYYEYIELLSPEREGRSRFYSQKELARMTLIMRGRRFGFSLEEIRQWLEMYEADGSATQYKTFIEYADRQLAALDAQQVEIAETIEDLKKLRADVEKLL